MVTVMTAVSCSETDYMTFDTARNGIYFTKDTLNYSFSVTPIEIKTHTYKIPFRIMGSTSSQPRTVAYTVVAEKTTAKQGVQYNIGEAVVEPDSINGYIPVEILRNGLEGTYATGYTRYTLHIELKSNDNFVPMRRHKAVPSPSTMPSNSLSGIAHMATRCGTRQHSACGILTSSSRWWNTSMPSTTSCLRHTRRWWLPMERTSRTSPTATLMYSALSSRSISISRCMSSSAIQPTTT